MQIICKVCKQPNVEDNSSVLNSDLKSLVMLFVNLDDVKLMFRSIFMIIDKHLLYTSNRISKGMLLMNVYVKYAHQMWNEELYCKFGEG